MNTTIETITTAELDHVVEWSRLLEVLARDADALVAAAPDPAADQSRYRDCWQGLVDRWFALLWPSVKPVFIAESARRARAELRPVEVLLREGSPEGFQLVANDRYDYLLKLEVKDQELQRHRDAVAAGERSKPGPRGRPPKVVEEVPETDHEQQVAARRAEYAAKVAAEREAEAQAEAERRAKVLEIAAAAAPAPGPEPEWEEPLEPEALADEKAEPEPGAEAQEPGNDGRVWVLGQQLAAELGISFPTVSKHRAAGLFDGLWRMPAPDRVRGTLFDLEGCRAALEGHRAALAARSQQKKHTPEEERERRRLYQAQRRARLREQQQGDTPAAMPVTIEPDEAQGPPVEPSTPAEAGPDAAALLAKLAADPALLQRLAGLVAEGESRPAAL